MSTIMIKGLYRDVLRDMSNRLIFDSGWQSNLIVRNCRILLAGFMINETTLGIQKLKIGKGDPSWDITPPPAPDPETTIDLVDADPRIIQLADLVMEYLLPDGGPSSDPTNHIQITVPLDAGVPPPDPGSTIYPMREFGLFGQFTINGTVEEYMIDYIQHPVIKKDQSVSMERKIRLIF